MLLKVLLLGFFIGASHAWTFGSSEKHVAKKLTTNVTLDCRYDGEDNGENAITLVTRLRILKYQNGNQWQTIAKVSDHRPAVITSFSDVTTSGKAGVPSESFITLHFETATDDVVGQFYCEADGYDANDDLVAVKTDVIVISERGVSYQDLLDIILSLKKEETTDHALTETRLELLEKSTGLLDKQGKSRGRSISQLKNEFDTAKGDFNNVINDLLENQLKLRTELDILKNANQVMNQAWPEGVYSLLNTSDGCPVSHTFDWVMSNLQVTTDRKATNKDNTSTPIHLAGPVLERIGGYNFVNMNFCSKKISSAGPAWPKGSYCVGAYTTSCPTNLVVGYITIDRDNKSPYDVATDLPSASRSLATTMTRYCCRSDGDATTPILLPSTSPFYLYRLGGTCQEVIGMNVSNEWVFMDTMEASDAYSTADHPDGTIKNVQIELCYYTPKHQEEYF